jgi:hypothetical protein
VLNHFTNIFTLQCSETPFFIAELVVDVFFLKVRSSGDPDPELGMESEREHAEKLFADAEAKHGRHQAIWDRGRENHVDRARNVIDFDVVRRDDVELLKCQGMLGVEDESDMLIDLEGINRFTLRGVQTV